MHIEACLDQYNLDQLIKEVRKVTGLTKEEISDIHITDVLVEHICDRYLTTEYIDWNHIDQLFDVPKAERIVEAAIKIGERIWTGQRHSDIVPKIIGDRAKVSEGIQGFMTTTGRFVDRQEAVKIAVKSGQITLPKKCNPQDTLYSEDLY